MLNEAFLDVSINMWQLPSSSVINPDRNQSLVAGCHTEALSNRDQSTGFGSFTYKLAPLLQTNFYLSIRWTYTESINLTGLSLNYTLFFY